MSDQASESNSSAPAGAESQEAQLRESLKRCSPETVQAALEFLRTGDKSLVSAVVLGIVERFLEPEGIETLRKGDDSVKFMEDLGMDSLTMIEAIMLVEECLKVSIKNEELLDLRTVGDLKAFIAAKMDGEAAPAAAAKIYPVEQIAAILPQQDPFLFLQTASLADGGATGTYTISGDESFLEGHFKDNPVFPASILLEALGQLAVFHFLETEKSGTPLSAEQALFFTGADGVRCHRVCRPGDTLELAVTLKRRRDPMLVYSGKITVKGEKAASAEEISLVLADESQVAAT